MTGRIYQWARRGAVFGVLALAALTAAGDGAGAEEMVTVTMTKSQYEAMMNLVPRIEQLEAQVRNNGQNLKLQQDQQQLTDEKVAAVSAAAADREPVDRGQKGVTLEISGQVNMGVLYANSGDSDGSDENRKVWIVDNDNSSSRFRFIAKAPVDENLTLGAVIELEVERNASDEITQDDIRSFGFDFNLRKVEAVIDHKSYGRLRIGQGDTASNGIAEQDLSGTSVIAKSQIEAVGGGLIFRAPGGAFNGGCGSNCNVDNYFNNQDGLGMKMRVRYDTPAWHGTSLSTSYIDGGAYDVRVQHSYQWPAAGGLKVAAAAGWYDGMSIGANEGVSGSASVFHVPTGLSLTGAAGQVVNGGGDPEPGFWYLKGGWRGNIFDFGTTAISADYWSGKDYEVLGSNSDSVGFQVVQRIVKTSTQLYIGGRVFMVDNTGFGQFQDIYTVMSGLRQLF